MKRLIIFVCTLYSSFSMAQSLQVWKPTVIPMEAPEIVNPYRGLYRWRNNEVVPMPRPSFDAYSRFTWNMLESAPGVYNFKPIDDAINLAAQQGRKFSFRIQCVVSDEGIKVPNYIEALCPKGFWFEYESRNNVEDTLDTYVPDWNDPKFWVRFDSLLSNLAKRYNGDPRLSHIDAEMYGNWAEGHCYNFPYPHANGADRITPENARKMIDLFCKRFSKTRLVILANHDVAARYALAKSDQIGWRRDAFGHKDWMNELLRKDYWPLLEQRYKTAPVVVENYGGSASNFLDAPRQVRKFHVSLIGNGNMKPWSQLSQANKDSFMLAAKLSGYRFVADSVTYKKVAYIDRSFVVESWWRNMGVAPAYENYKVVYQLIDPASGAVIKSYTSALNLKHLLPTADSNIKIVDKFYISKSIKSYYPYQLRMVVVDADNSRKSISLAIEDLSQTPGYEVGEVTFYWPNTFPVIGPLVSPVEELIYMTAVPNPATAEIHFAPTILNESALYVHIRSLNTGYEVYSHTGQAMAIQEQINDLYAQLESGIYVITVVTPNKEAKSYKLFKDY